jgi:hypothetical protein
VDTKELRAQADRFFSTFVIAFLFIYVGIVLQTRDSTKQAALNEQARTQQQLLINSLSRQIRLLDGKNSLEVAPRPAIDTESTLLAAAPSNIVVPSVGGANASKSRKAALALAQREYTHFKEEVELDEKLAKATADLARLSSDLSKEAAHSIPGIPISVPDSLILSLFPLAVFGGLFRIWVYRSDFLRTAPTGECAPLWAAPLPWSRFSMTVSQWILANLTILVIIGLTVTLTFDYLESSLASDDSLKRGLARVYQVVGVCTLVCYLASLLRAMFARESIPAVARPEGNLP